MSVWDQMREAGYAQIEGRYGELMGEQQAGLTQAGFGRSGIMGTQLAKLSAGEKMDKAGWTASVAKMQSDYEQRERMIAKVKKQAKKDKKKARYSYYGQLAGMAVGGVIGAFAGNPMMGAAVGGMAGGAIGGAIA